MTLRLRNTLTRSVEPVVPLEPGRVRMYTCGPTVYRYAHVGNLRSYLLADLIRRVLLYHGLEVVHVKNITDVGHLRDERFDRGEDRMLVAAGLESKTPAEIAEAYEAAFHADEAAVNILPAHVFPRATEHIADMIVLAERLVDSGFAYVSMTFPSSARAIAERSSTTSWTRPTSPSGSTPGKVAFCGGQRPAGERASRAGTSNAPRCRRDTWDPSSRSTPVESTTSFRTTKTRSPSRPR